MKILLSIFFSLFIINVFAQSDEPALEQELNNLPGVSFKRISQPGDRYLKYDLLIKQPLDHQHPEKGSFYQHALLLHKGFNKPVVLQNDGYWLNDYRNEIEQVLNANNINMEYRFYGKSIPDSTPWEYLTIEQATADMHSIRELFRNIYKEKWISTGVSKGGETTIYYKYFYPQDVDLSVPYVAPLDNSLEDKRIYHFFDTISTPECRKKILQLQLFLLQHENEALEKLKLYSKDAGLHYDYTGSIGKSFEYAVMEYSFSFWQYNGECNSIPSNQILDDYIKSLLKNSNISAFADEGIKLYEAHYYQAVTQSGYYGYNIVPFKGYLHYFTENPSAAFPPKSAPVKPFDSTLNDSVAKWLWQNGNNILYIYGGTDTWTAAGIIVSNQVNSKRFVIPNTNHTTARIKNMSPVMQQEFIQKVKVMTGLEVNTNGLR